LNMLAIDFLGKENERGKFVFHERHPFLVR
jgi:hypothetical protein